MARDYTVVLSEDIGPRIAGSPEEAEASQYIVSALESFGYLPEVQVFTDSPPGRSGEVTSSNVIAVNEGLSEEIVIIGAHYDSVEVGNGADDNASGVAVMLEAAKMLKDVDTPYTIYFVAFGAEEVGLIGSNYYVDQMTEEDKANAIAMVNLDSLIAGDNAYVYGDDAEGGEIRDWLISWAEKEDLPLQIQTGENPEYPAGTSGDWSDHVPFKQAGIPYVYFESTNWLIGEKDGYTQVDPKYGTEGQIWHTEYDYLEYIDATFPGRVDERLSLFASALYKICTEYAITVSSP
ncbi:MAG: M20/M25/M40 family metallo-hydrolase [Proteobacteria bacterium]|nr:M20/M25/M40 family metallo-hydrolase [Pseudomonadota bacterium]